MADRVKTGNISINGLLQDSPTGVMHATHFPKGMKHAKPQGDNKSVKGNLGASKAKVVDTDANDGK